MNNDSFHGSDQDHVEMPANSQNDADDLGEASLPTLIPVAGASSWDEELGAADPQVHNRLLNLSLRIGRMERLLEQMAREVDSSGSQLNALTRNLTDARLMQPLYTHMADLSTRLQSSQTQLEQLTHTLDATASREQFDELARTLKRLNRTQFKSNTLGESKEEQVAHALKILQDVLDGRGQVEARTALLAGQRREDDQRDVRATFAADFLPALDGLELALENGNALLARQHQSLAASETAYDAWLRAMDEAKQAAQAGVWHKLRRSLRGVDMAASAPATEPPAGSIQEVIDATQAWLDGLQLVQRRFFDLLTAEGIEEIRAQGQHFDPHLHVAVETMGTDDITPNMVVDVVRKGYRQHGRVLRYAEVVVSQTAHKDKIQKEKASEDESVE